MSDQQRTNRVTALVTQILVSTHDIRDAAALESARRAVLDASAISAHTATLVTRLVQALHRRAVLESGPLADI